MRMLFLFRYYAVCFILEHLFLQRMASFALGSFESVSAAKCEYEDANLTWRNTPAYSLNDVYAMAWYKGNDSLIASFEISKKFKEYPPYIGRVMQIEETGIQLKRTNRSDSGSYWLFLTLANQTIQLDAVTHFEVIVAPSSHCKPNITEEGSRLKAQLPSEGCGTPPLSPKWKNTNKTLIEEANNQSILYLGGDFEAGEYIVCAEGYSAKCYQGNISDLCTVITKSHHGPRNDGLTSNPVSIIVPVVILALIGVAVSIVVVIWWKRKLFCEKRQSGQMYLATEDRCSEDIAREFSQIEEVPLIEKGETLWEGLPEIQSYLRGLYKDMTRVSLSPTGKENFVDVSEVYIDLDFQQMETRDLQLTETDPAWTSSYKVSVSNDDIRLVKGHNQRLSPIIIMGCSGSGKSTWCKHLVHCWSELSRNEDANVHDINLPNLGEYQILLYLPLKPSDRGRSFQELLQHYLFSKQPEYLNTVTKHIHDTNNPQSVLILIDGFDIIGEHGEPMSELLDHNLLFSSTVIFTCRPSCLKWIVNAYADISIQLELFKVCEIPPERSAAYASKVLRILNQQNKESNLNNFLTFTRYLHVQSLLQLPYLCLMLLVVWMENKNPYIEITDILLRIVEHILESEETVTRCTTKIMTLSQIISAKVLTNVKKLDDRFINIRNLMYELSRTTEEIFQSKSKLLTNEDRLFDETSSKGRDTLPLEVLHDIGLITESFPLQSVESPSTVTFTNMLIYQLFVSMAIVLRKGRVFEYIVSDLEVALKHSMVIHMLYQFSPTLVKEICVELRKLKTYKHDKHVLSDETNTKVTYSITKVSKGGNFHQLKWLQYLMYKGDLDDEKLLLLTNVLRSLDSLNSLVVENNENNDELVFWLPCSQTLEKLKLSITNCTLLLCLEWNYQIPIKLREVHIRYVVIRSRDEQVLSKALLSCQNIKKPEISLTVVSTDDLEIEPLRSSSQINLAEIKKDIYVNRN
ncbi:hypothetical protein ACJMK2_041401 [Sinanodonta woodiana]|uniref:NACHT domain-containing protein n=1 Tax=Sinanodonta woodiana TaxID=1069815 RepID=A0ABD3W7T0_SINWO